MSFRVYLENEFQNQLEIAKELNLMPSDEKNPFEHKYKARTIFEQILSRLKTFNDELCDIPEKAENNPNNCEKTKCTNSTTKHEINTPDCQHNTNKSDLEENPEIQAKTPQSKQHKFSLEESDLLNFCLFVSHFFLADSFFDTEEYTLSSKNMKVGEVYLNKIQNEKLLDKFSQYFLLFK